MPRPKPRLALAREPEPTSPRDILRQRLSNLAEVDAAVARAEQMVEQARANLAAMEEKAATGEDAERRVRAHRVQAVKAGRAGDEDLPEVLELAREVARRAKAGLTDAKAVLVDLGNELTDVQAIRLATQRTVELAAQEVIKAEDAPRIAAALEEARAAVHRLELDLTGMCGIHVRQNFAGYNAALVGSHFERHSGPMTFSEPVMAALHAPSNALDLRLRPGEREGFFATWTAYFEALCQDADATPPA